MKAVDLVETVADRVWGLVNPSQYDLDKALCNLRQGVLPMLSTIEVVATTYGVFMSLAPLLQARKIRQRRSSSDVSILYLVVLVVGVALYLTYGVSIANRFLIITCTVSIIATTTTLLIALAYRNPQPTKPPDAPPICAVMGGLSRRQSRQWGMLGDPDSLRHLWTSNSSTLGTRCARGAGALPPF